MKRFARCAIALFVWKRITMSYGSETMRSIGYATRNTKTRLPLHTNVYVFSVFSLRRVAAQCL